MPWTNGSLMIGLESMETSVMLRDDWLYGQDVTDIGLLALADRALTLRTLKLKLALSSSAERCSEVAVMECELCPRLLLLFRLLVGCYPYLFLMCHELPSLEACFLHGCCHVFWTVASVCKLLTHVELSNFKRLSDPPVYELIQVRVCATNCFLRALYPCHCQKHFSCCWCCFGSVLNG